jgi:6-phosphogluconate dehydrogenase (decarboxylating)
MQIAVVGLGRMGANIVRAGLCPEQRSLRAFRLSRPGRFCRQAPVRHASMNSAVMWNLS